MKPEKPLLIVLTPVFNEAWILPAFLRATSLWADYIIIADQMSTDGSRDLYPQFEKVIVVDNPRKEMHQAATRRLLFAAAKKIPGDKIVFALDADEFLSGDFVHTESWRTILNSQPGDMFCFRWMNLAADMNHYSTWQPYCWAAHVEKGLFDGEFPDNFIHEWRIPWPKHVNQEYTFDDISFLHFARVNTVRQRNKERFYQVSQSAPMPSYSGIAFHRSYHQKRVEKSYVLPADAFAFYKAHNLDVTSMLNLQDEGKHYTESVIKNFAKKGICFFRKLDIWDDEFLLRNHLDDPRRPIDKLIHWYLRKTVKISDTFFIRAIDYLLKRVY